MGEMVEKHDRARGLGATLYAAGFRACWFQTTWADVHVPGIQETMSYHILHAGSLVRMKGELPPVISLPQDAG